MTKRRLCLSALAVLACLSLWAAPGAADPDGRAARSGADPRAELQALLAQQAAAWSRGDLDAFCSVYAEDALFLSPSGTTRGRQAVLDRYRKRYPDRAAMGTLTLEPIEIRLGGSAAEAAALAQCGGTLLDIAAAEAAARADAPGGTAGGTPEAGHAGSAAASQAGGVPAAAAQGSGLPAAASQGSGLPAAASQGGGLPAAASIAARWKLSYPDKAAAEGLTLIVFERRPEGWRIVQDASM